MSLLIPQPYATYVKLAVIAVFSITLFLSGYKTADRSWTIKTDKLKLDSAKALQDETNKTLESERAKKALADFIQINYNQEVTRSHELQERIDDTIVAHNGLRDKWGGGCSNTTKTTNPNTSIPTGRIITSGESRLSIQLSTALSRDYGRAERFRKRFEAAQAWAKSLR
ncbi:MAG: hypothetical protein ABL870_09830 [Sediminibacterium sp.]